MKEFLLSDESLNDRGCVVLTSGIRLQRFLSNPVMLLMHNRTSGVAGRWENLRIDNRKMYATPVFDEAHEPGKSTKEKVENEFLKGASIGIENCEIEVINGVETVTGCDLVEVSICDIPSNQNALQLYYNNNPVDFSTYLQLTLNSKTMNEQDLKSVLQALELPDNATIQDVLNAIETLKKGTPAEGDVKKVLSLAYKDGIIGKSELSDLTGMFKNNPMQLSTYLNNRRKESEKVDSTKYDSFVKANSRKFRTYSHDFVHGTMKQFALKDFSTFQKMIESAPEVLKPSELIGLSAGNNSTSKSDWTLEDYRKKAPQELKQNPELYRELLDKESQKK